MSEITSGMKATTHEVPKDILAQLQALYDKNPALQVLNQVDGFEPLDFIRIIETESKEQQMYMDVKNRKLWFRMKYSTGKIAKVAREITPDHATFEARVYADRNDAPENFLANAYATRYRSEDPVFGNKYVELAEVAAVGRALADAGFNIQGGVITQDDIDPRIVDAGIQVNTETGEITNPGTANEPTFPVQQPVVAQAPAQPQPAAEKPAQTGQPPAAPVTNGAEILSPNMTVEELKQRMTVESASKVIITEGFVSYRNKTMGWLAMNKPNALNYFKEKAQNNVIKAAAQFLLEAAQTAA